MNNSCELNAKNAASLGDQQQKRSDIYMTLIQKQLPMMFDDDARTSVFLINGKALIKSLLMGMEDLYQNGEMAFNVDDIRTYLEPDKFVELALRKDISDAARKSMQSFLASMGWKADVSDRTKWGDFDRIYSYTKNYFNSETLSSLPEI